MKRILATTIRSARNDAFSCGLDDTCCVDDRLNVTSVVTRATTTHERAQIHPFPNKKISITVKNHWRNVVRCRIASNAAFCEDHPEYVRYVY